MILALYVLKQIYSVSIANLRVHINFLKILHCLVLIMLHHVHPGYAISHVVIIHMNICI